MFDLAFYESVICIPVCLVAELEVQQSGQGNDPRSQTDNKRGDRKFKIRGNKFFFMHSHLSMLFTYKLNRQGLMGHAKRQ